VAFGLGWHYEAGIQFVRLILAGVFDEVTHLQRPIADYFKQNLYVKPSGIWSPRFSLRLCVSASKTAHDVQRLFIDRHHSEDLSTQRKTRRNRRTKSWLTAALSSSLTTVDIPPGTLYMLILKTIARLGPMHGFGIARHIQQISEDVLQVEEGSLYPALQRMLIKGWVVAEWKQSENNRRARYYRLTPEGRKQLSRELTEFEQVTAAIVRVIQPV